MKVINQRKDWDCGVASIAMLLDIPYEGVLTTVLKNVDDPKLKKRGLILRQMEQVLKLYKFKTRRVYRKDGYLDGATGILGLNHGLCAPAGHWVVVKEGLIIDPSDKTAMSPEEYCKAAKCRPATMLVID
jgi:ABC-type bacteriocin/lantibiotic exporter with double-glycine peptidase domain